ncbi:MAG: DnaJ domain-containing protein [Kaiparowitsia implicata GSE-PSE-MK54-09C]|jgi:curved DNA-binding protein|nr:DnaJ domain-containing protein [Kaiparowitsia implicata GSE-PSE-MK54-09C]
MASTDFKDYYAILGVTKTASADDIKRSFRQLARKYHPDMNPGDQSAEAKFKEVNEAYEVLSDPAKRSKYDQFGQYWKQAGGGFSTPPGSDFGGFDFNQYTTFEDFINELLGRFGGPNAAGYGPRSGASPGDFGNFGSGGFSSPPTAGFDLESTLTLTLAEAFNGVQKRLSLGAEVIDVRIPPGVKSGNKIRVRGKGQPSPYSQQRGDLYLRIDLRPHAFFKFDGDTVTCEVPITPDEAALGAAIEVPTLDGTVTMNIPPGIRSGQTLRLRGKGWVSSNGQRGDQMVKVSIVVSKQLSSVERELYEKLRANRSEDPRAQLRQVRL